MQRIGRRERHILLDGGLWFGESANWVPSGIVNFCERGAYVHVYCTARKCRQIHTHIEVNIDVVWSRVVKTSSIGPI